VEFLCFGAQRERTAAGHTLYGCFHARADSGLLGGLPEREVEIEAGNAGGRWIDWRVHRMTVEEQACLGNSESVA